MGRIKRDHLVFILENMNQISFRNLIKRVDQIQQKMGLREIEAASRSAGSYRNLIDGLTHDLGETNRNLDQILEAQNMTAANLGMRSRRAYQWIRFLSEDDNLLNHLDTLQRVNLFLPGYFSRPALKRIRFAFYHLGSLYKITEHKGNREILVQESFIDAPDQIIHAILEACSPIKRTGSQKIIRGYCFSSDFQKIRTRLEYLGIPPGGLSRGRVHDLEVSFRRVNQEFFQGRIPLPHLVWSSRLTYRKFGHYQWDIDTVMISKSLDQPQIASFVVDYVMYHELLHKSLGSREVNGRRMSHTTRFKKAEEKYPRYQEAKDQLTRLAKKRS
jgi:hypothetical protein